MSKVAPAGGDRTRVIYQTYEELRNDVQERYDNDGLAMFCFLMFLLDAGFAAWAFVVHYTVQESCDKPFGEYMLWIAIICTIVACGLACTCCCTARSFRSFMGTGQYIRNPSREHSFGQDMHESPPGLEEQMGLMSGKRKDADASVSGGPAHPGHKTVATSFTDSIFMACCSCSYLSCAFVAVIVLGSITLTWAWMEASNCPAAAPTLYSQAKLLSMALMCFLLIHLVFFTRVYSNCCLMWRMWRSEQDIIKLVDEQHHEKH